MPNRYEREIEEILSRMEESEPARGPADRIRPMRRPRARAPRSMPSFNITFVETLMLLSIILALVGCGLAYFNSVATLVSGIIGGVALLLFVVALVVGWRERFRPQRQAQWRGSTYVEVTPIRRFNPFRAIVTQVRVFRLRRQYRRAQREHDER